MAQIGLLKRSGKWTKVREKVSKMNFEAQLEVDPLEYGRSHYNDTCSWNKW